MPGTGGSDSDHADTSKILHLCPAVAVPEYTNTIGLGSANTPEMNKNSSIGSLGNINWSRRTTTGIHPVDAESQQAISWQNLSNVRLIRLVPLMLPQNPN